MMPSKHFLSASNTPDPEFPVEATSAITVLNFLVLAGSRCGAKIRDRAVPSGTTVTTASPGQGGWLHNGLRRRAKLNGNCFSSTDKRVRSTVSKSPAFTTLVGYS